MTMTGIEALDTTVHKTNEWLNDIKTGLGWEDRHRAYLALRTVLQTLRDRLVPDEAMNLSAQLPLLIRGIFFEGYRIAGKPDTEIDLPAFLSRVTEAFQRDPDIDAEQVVRGVFRVLSRRIPKGEIRDVRSQLPKSLQDLWGAAEM